MSLGGELGRRSVNLSFAAAHACADWAADQCLNYKDKDFNEQLARACGEQGVDLYFDNVGGEILDEMLSNMKQGGTVIACGGISGYNDTNPTVLKSAFFLSSLSFRMRFQTAN